MTAKRSLALLLNAAFCILVFISVAKAQPYLIGQTTLTFIDPSRNNRAVETEIFYPAQQSGTNVAVTAGTLKFPVISIGHGFVMTVDAYYNLRDMLVPEGYIVALPKTEGSFSPNHANFGRDLAFVIDALQQEGLNSSSRFFSRVDTMNCVMGHSMGGGAAHLAAAGSSSIKSIATLAAAETNPSAIGAAGNISIPALVFAGSNDCITPPNTNQLPMYNALKSNCKTYISISGGSHCQMSMSNGNCNGGELFAGCTAPAITRSQQHAIIKSYLIPWLNYQLKNNCQAGASFESLMQNDNKISFQNNCTFCQVSNTSDIQLPKDYKIYPNPFQQTINIDNYQQEKGPLSVVLSDTEGRTIKKSLLTKDLLQNPIQINTSDLPTGCYFLQINNGKQTQSYKLVKQL